MPAFVLLLWSLPGLDRCCLSSFVAFGTLGRVCAKVWVGKGQREGVHEWEEVLRACARVKQRKGQFQLIWLVACACTACDCLGLGQLIWLTLPFSSSASLAGPRLGYRSFKPPPTHAHTQQQSLCVVAMVLEFKWRGPWAWEKAHLVPATRLSLPSSPHETTSTATPPPPPTHVLPRQAP